MPMTRKASVRSPKSWWAIVVVAVMTTTVTAEPAPPPGGATLRGSPPAGEAGAAVAPGSNEQPLANVPFGLPRGTTIAPGTLHALQFVDRAPSAEQTISFTAPDTGLVGGTFALDATATSGGAVRYSLAAESSGCTVTGSTLTFTGVGTCLVNADRTGDANFEAAPPVQVAVSVTYMIKQFLVPSAASSSAVIAGRTIPVWFRLVGANNKPIVRSTGSALASAGIKASLTRSGAPVATSNCSWVRIVRIGGMFRCALTAPKSVLTGRANLFRIRVILNSGHTWVQVEAPVTTVYFSPTPGSLQDPGSLGRSRRISAPH